jgi:DNA-binding MarR family transcriptional regulator
LSSQVLSAQLAVEPNLEAWIRFLRAHASLTRQMSARLEADHGLTLNDYDCLVQLAYAPERSLRRVDLARSVLLSPSGITRLLDGLEREGWVEKRSCDSDARVTYAHLTDAGLEKFKSARKTHLADIEEAFGSRFTPEELDAVSSLLGRLLDSDEPPECAKEPE